MPDAQLSARSLEALLGDWRGAAPGYQSLADRVRLLVLDGRIPIGTRLPAERDLAGRLDLSRTTVSSAYRQLREGGFLDSVRGSGSVARLPGPALALPMTGGEGMLDFTKAALPAAASLPAAAPPPPRSCRTSSRTPATTRSACRTSARPSPTGTPSEASRPRPTRCS
ncbi:GntR family transcriptional regulator [Leifsonia sp. P73]|uniref:GntR family transcriptional regulator n=1 Tax=Leifsonia sp. P73 TaxID=3423959 RepID=UPI003DA43557